MADQLDYETMLADLKAKREAAQATIAALDQAIAGLEAVLGRAGESGVSTPIKSGDISNIPPDAFFRLGIAEAAKKYLSMVKRPQSTPEIAAALQRGGLTHSSKNFINTLFAILYRQHKQNGDIVRVNKDWGLREWYPGRKRGSKNSQDQESSSEEKEENSLL